MNVNVVSVLRLTFILLIGLLPSVAKASLIRSGNFNHGSVNGWNHLEVGAGCFAILEIPIRSFDDLPDIRPINWNLSSGSLNGAVTSRKIQEVFGEGPHHPVPQQMLWIPGPFTLRTAGADSNAVLFKVYRSEAFYLEALTRHDTALQSLTLSLDQKLQAQDSKTKDELKDSLDKLPQRLLTNSVIELMKAELLNQLTAENKEIRAQNEELRLEIDKLKLSVAAIEAKAGH